jgi:hypothetical protein
VGSRLGTEAKSQLRKLFKDFEMKFRKIGRF